MDDVSLQDVPSLKRFQLCDFLKFWKAKLGRKEININVAHSRVTHGNGALSFERKYDFAWQEEPSKSSLGDLPTPASSAFSVQEPSKSSTPASPVQVPMAGQVLELGQLFIEHLMS